MAELKYLIDDAKLDRIVADWIYIYKNSETICDPDWVDPEDGSECERIPKYTDNQWIREHIRRWIVQQIKRSRQKQSIDSASIIASTDGEIT